jgi:glutamate racemase
MLEGARPRAAVAEVCAHLPIDLDALILGCTHYPVLEEHFRAVLAERVALVDPATIQAHRAAELLGERARGSGATEYLTSGDEAPFFENVARVAALMRRQQSHMKEGEEEPRRHDRERDTGKHL